jgi:hypothetical protein
VQLTGTDVGQVHRDAIVLPRTAGVSTADLDNPLLRRLKIERWAAIRLSNDSDWLPDENSRIPRSTRSDVVSHGPAAGRLYSFNDLDYRVAARIGQIQ